MFDMVYNELLLLFNKLLISKLQVRCVIKSNAYPYPAPGANAEGIGACGLQSTLAGRSKKAH
jgi:hypothetical protein